MRRFRWLAMVIALVMVAAACGRDDDDEQRRRHDDDDQPPRAAAAPSPRTSATLTDVCQDGQPKGSPAQGVTPTEIKIATFSDPGFAGRPGLNQELFDTADVFSAWCNDRGGINGRKIVVDKRDSALTQVQAKMTEACAEDFMMVGGGAVFDQDGVETRLECLHARRRRLRGEPGEPRLGPPRPAGAELGRRPSRSATSSTSRRSSRRARRTTASSPATSPPRASSATSTRRPPNSLGWKHVYKDVYPAIGAERLDPVRRGAAQRGRQGPHLGRRAGEPGQAGRGDEQHRLHAEVHPHRRQPLRREADRPGRRGAQGQHLHPQRLRPVRGRRRRAPRPSSTSTRSPSTSRTARTAPTSACRRGRPGSSSPRRRRSAATTSPASACTTTPRRSPSWTGGGLHATQRPEDRRHRGECFAHRAGDAGRLRARRRSTPNDGHLPLRRARASTS